MPQENAVLQKVRESEKKWEQIFQPAISSSVKGNDNKISRISDSIYSSDIAALLPAFSSVLRPNTETQMHTNTKKQKYTNTLFSIQTQNVQELQKKLQFDTTFLEKAMRGAIQQGVQNVPIQTASRQSDHTEWRTIQQLQTQSKKYDSISSSQKENTSIQKNTPILINNSGYAPTETGNLSSGRFPVQADLSVRLKNQSAISNGNIKTTVSQVKSKIEQEVQKQDVRGKVLTSFEMEPKKDFFNQVQNTMMQLPQLEQIEKTIDIAVTGNPEIKNSVDVSSSDFGIQETKNQSVIFLLEGNKEILNQLNVMAEEFGITPSVMQTIAVELLGKLLPQQTEKPQVASFGIPSEIAQTIGINLTGKKNIMGSVSASASDFGIPSEIAQIIGINLTGKKNIVNSVSVSARDFGIPSEIEQTIGINLTGQKNIMGSVSVSASDFGIPSSIYQSVAVHLTPYVTTGNASLGSLRRARGGIVGKNGAVGFADGGIVRGGPQLITVAEEGTPEMIIPLGSQRKQRAVQLWKKTGHILGIPGFANGGIVFPLGKTEETSIAHTANVSNRENSSIYTPVITDNISFITATIEELFANISKKFSSHTVNSFAEQNLALYPPVASNSSSLINAQIEKVFENISQNIATHTENTFGSPNQSIYAPDIQDSFSSIYSKIKTFAENIQLINKSILENKFEIASLNTKAKNVSTVSSFIDTEKYFNSQLSREKQNQFILSQKSEKQYFDFANTEKLLRFNNTAFQKNSEKEISFSTIEKQILPYVTDRLISPESKKLYENKHTLSLFPTQEKPFTSLQTTSQNEKNLSHITPSIAQYPTNTPFSVTIGNITFQIEVNGENNDLLSSIEAQKEEIADCIAQVISQTLQEKFENTPLRGGKTV